MTAAMLVVYGCLSAVPVFICWLLLRSQDRLITNLKEAVTRLYADNSRLTEALVRKEGQYVDLKPPESLTIEQAAQEELDKAYGKHAPYWQTRTG